MILPTFITVCSQVFGDCVTVELLGVGVGNLIINTIILSTCYKYANDAFVAKDVDSGLAIIYVWLCVTIMNELYRRYVSEPVQQRFSTNVDIDSEETMNNVLIQLDYEANRDISESKDVGNKMLRSRFKISSMVSSYVTTAMSLCTLLGYVFWIIMISPMSLIGYTIAMTLLCTMVETSTPSTDNKMASYDKYWFYKTNFINENVHGQGVRAMKNINKANQEIEVMRHEKMTQSDVLGMYVGIAFALVMAFNCYCYGSSMTVANLITYIQYCSSLKHAIVSCFHMYKNYVEGERDYREFTDLMSQYREKEDMLQITPLSSIVIESLNYTYPNSSFCLNITETIEIHSGNIVLVNGDSGHGKSTFCDILGGYKHDDEYVCIISVDGDRINGFECLRDSRIYTEQKDHIFSNMSVTEIVSNKVYDGTVKMEFVMLALEMCCCTDFVTIDNVHDSKPKFSGGQEGRVKIARTVYRILTTFPKIVLLDEIDKAVQPGTVVKIMDNIFKHCKENKIFTFVIAHTTEMQAKEKYDKVITFVKGKVI